jgi:hypothetical protein
MPLAKTSTGNPATPTSPLSSGAGVQAIALAVGGTTNLDFSLGDFLVCTFGAGNCTLTFSNIPNGRRITIQFIQDSVGSRTLTWPATAKFATATAPTLSTGASKRDSVTFIGDGTNLYASNAAVIDIR